MTTTDVRDGDSGRSGATSAEERQAPARPDVVRFSHASLSIRDLSASVAWYCEVLGFRILEHIDGPSWDEDVLVHPCGVVLTLQQHRTNDGSTFEPTRTGMDHLALLVPSRVALDDWHEYLTALGVEHSAPVEEHYGAVLSLKDPDRIALELFWREDHP